MRSGADAQRGDLVRNLLTGEIAYVIAPSQWGTLMIGETPDSAPLLTKWERYAVEIIGHQEKLTHV